MPSYTFYANAFSTGGQGATINDARNGVSGVTTSGGSLAAVFNYENSFYEYWQLHLLFNTSSIVGTVTTASLNVTVQSLWNGSHTLEARVHSWPTYNDPSAFTSGSALAALALLGSLAVSSTGAKSITATPSTIASASQFKLTVHLQGHRTGSGPADPGFDGAAGVGLPINWSDPAYLSITTVLSAGNSFASLVQ